MKLENNNYLILTGMEFSILPLLSCEDDDIYKEFEDYDVSA